MTTTYPPMVTALYDKIGRGCVSHHEPTEDNKIGQSGLHTLINDILDIVYAAPNERDASKDLFTYFQDGKI